MQSEAAQNQPLVSVIMPTYNRADLVTRSIESVLAQTHRNLELVVVDDRSKDNTASVLSCLSAKDSRVRYFLNDGKKGAAGARNTGLAMVQGDYVAFLDDDDEFLPEKITRHLEPFQDPEIGAVITASSGLLALAKVGDSQWLEIEFAPQKLFHPCNVMCRTSVLHDIRFRCNYMEWRDLAFQLYQNGTKVVLAEHQLVRINNTGNSLSSNAAAMIDHALMNAQEYFSYSEGKAEEMIFKHYLANCHKNRANLALKDGEVLKACKHYWASYSKEHKLRNLLPFV